MTSSIAELRAAGITFQADEAVAIAQQLIDGLLASPDADQLQPPFGPPSSANVFLKDDGAVECRGCRVTPAVSEVGIFLDDLLPPGSPRVPGGLRYSIARALLNVDVPPFDSLSAFADALARHERGRRVNHVRRVLARADSGPAIVPIAAVERRRVRASASSLRRELREADARLYQQREGLSGRPAVIDLVAMTPPAPPRGRPYNAAAACLAVGLSLTAAGAGMHAPRAPIAAPQTVTAAQTTVVRDEPRVELASIRTPERGIITVRDVPSRPVPATRVAARRAPVKRASRAQTGDGRGRIAHQRSRGLLDRLKLGWLRTAFTVH